MKITPEEIEKIARLARISLSEAEVKKIAPQLNGILNYVDKLGELDTSGITPMTHALEVSNAFREDEIKPSLPRKDSLANAPVHNGEAFVVPRII